MKLKAIQVGVRSSVPKLSVNRSGGIGIGINAVREFNLQKAKSLRVYQDEDSLNDFYVEFSEKEDLEVILRTTDKGTFGNSTSVYKKMRDQFKKQKTFTFIVAKPQNIHGLNVYPLLINLSNL